MCITVHHLISDEPSDTNIKERIHNYHGYIETAIGGEDFGTSFDGYYSFINDDDEGTTTDDPNEDYYQDYNIFLKQMRSQKIAMNREQPNNTNNKLDMKW